MRPGLGNFLQLPNKAVIPDLMSNAQPYLLHLTYSLPDYNITTDPNVLPYL